MAIVSLVDLSEHLPPIEEPTVVTVVYDSLTNEVISFMEERDDGVYCGVVPIGATKVTVKKTPDVLKYSNVVYSKNYYDVKKQMVISKPEVKLTADKLSAIGNGEDIVTVKVECKDYLGSDVQWDKLKVKCITGKDVNGNDIPGIAQVSTEVLEFDKAKAEQTFKVRSFSRGKTFVKVKYFWEEGRSPKLSDGSPSFPISYGEVELSFTNPGF